MIMDTKSDETPYDHSVVYDGRGGFWGNSSTLGHPVHQTASEVQYTGTPVGYITSDYSGGMATVANKTAGGFASAMLQTLGKSLQDLKGLSSLKTGADVAKWTDSAGMNLLTSQQTPTTGDMIYTTNNTYVVGENGSYIGAHGETGADWTKLEGLLSTYTPRATAMRVTPENAKEMMGKIKLSDDLIKWDSNVHIDPSVNAVQLQAQRYEEANKRYESQQKHIENRRAEFGQYDATASEEEYAIVSDRYTREKANQEYLQRYSAGLEERITKMFQNPLLQSKMKEAGISDWHDLSSKSRDSLVQEYEKVTKGQPVLSTALKNFDSLQDSVREAGERTEEYGLKLKKLQGWMTPEEKLQYSLENTQNETELWKAQYAKSTGAVEGLEWQTYKRRHEDALKDIDAYNKALEDMMTNWEELNKDPDKHAQEIRELRTKIIQTQTELAKAQAEAYKTTDKLSRQSKQTVSGMLKELIVDAKSFKDIWKEIWGQLTQIAIDRALGLHDTTNSVWDLVTNVLKIGKQPTAATSGIVRDGVGEASLRYANQNSTFGLFRQNNPQNFVVNPLSTFWEGNQNQRYSRDGGGFVNATQVASHGIGGTGTQGIAAWLLLMLEVT